MEVEFFDSFEDMQKRLQEQMRIADSHAGPWQIQIKPGDYFQRDSGYGFPIYGEVLQEDEPREAHVQHYRLCRCYSVVCVEGEVGDVHVSTIEQILTEAEFEEAKEHGWRDEVDDID